MKYEIVFIMTTSSEQTIQVNLWRWDQTLDIVLSHSKNIEKLLGRSFQIGTNGMYKFVHPSRLYTDLKVSSENVSKIDRKIVLIATLTRPQLIEII